MAATQQLGDDVWSYTDAPAPKVNDVLNQVADFLSAVGFKKTLKAIEKEAKGDGFEIDFKAWKQTVADGSAPALTQLWYEWQAKKGGKAEVDDDSSSASSDSESSSDSSSEDSDSDSDSDDEAMVIDVKAEVASSDSSDSEAEVKPKAKKDTKRKRSPSPSSSSASSSEESSDSDSSSDDAPPAKKRVVEKKKASSGSSSDSSSASSSSESDSSSSSDDSSSSEESSSSESEAEAPAPKKKESKKEKKETKKPKTEEPKKEKKEKKSEDVSASSSATLGRPSPDAVEESAESTSVEDPTAGMHPSRLAMLPAALKPKVVAVAVVDADGKKVKKQNVPFSRISADQYVDPRLASNAYVPYDYAEKAHRDLIVTKGKGFTKEKNKKKRGSYRGGAIDLAPKGFKFDD
ncbi:hypothetical protein Q7P35_011619 [Cladosporium inversicolor]